jgi:predicted dehydrogenase
VSVELLARYGRRLRLGMVGGGIGSVIGETHRIAARLDNRFELVAGCLSRDPERARASAVAALIPPDRAYNSHEEMAEREAARAEDGIEVVCVCTPPDSHLEIARAFLTRGIDVICDKPLTATLEDAVALVEAVRASGRLLALAHNYAAYPMVRQARAMVAAGAIGAVRLVHAEFAVGVPAMVRHEPEPARRHWRFDADVLGEASVLGEVGSHAHHLARFVTGLEVHEVAAELTRFVPERRVYDDAQLNLRLADGARGHLWASYVAAGNEHGLALRVHGERGGLQWSQERPAELWHMPLGEPPRRITPGGDDLAPAARRGTRVPKGHPEGFLEAFANVYTDVADVLLARKLGAPPDPHALGFPTAEDGAAGLALIEAAVASHRADGAWTDARWPRPAGEQGRRP